MTRWMIAAMLGAGLAGCGGGEAGTQGSKDQGAAAAPASHWDATQACAMLDAGKLSALTGRTFTAAKLVSTVPMTAASAAVSTCQYTGEGGALAMLLVREAPVDDASPEAIAKARTANGMMEPAEDVPGLGKAALWRSAPMARTLQVFFDERRSVVVTLAGREGTLDAASAVARAVAP